MSELKETEFGRIPKHWDYLRIEDTDIQIGDGNYSSKYPKASELLSEGIPFISSTDLRNGKISKNNLRYISVEHHSRLLKGHIKQGDVLIVVRGNGVGQVGLVSEEFEDANINAQMAYLGRSNKINGIFLYYLLLKYYWDGVTETVVSGSAQPQITVTNLKTLSLAIPPFKEQEEIAEILSSLDDKIELLHLQNKTIEELAQALFRQWFIEEAKDDWKEYEVRNFATHKKISIKPTQNPNDEFLHFSLPAFDTNKEPSIELGSDIKSNKYQVEPFSILMSKLNPKTPRVWDIYFEPKVNSICSTEFQVIQPNEKELFPFISTLLKSDKVRGELTMSASGTSGSHQRVKPEDILNINFLTPSVDKIKEFSELLEPNYLKIVQNQKQIETLKNMRDTLLPKLMSGEVRVEI